jgi:hypothetical protein
VHSHRLWKHCRWIEVEIFLLYSTKIIPTRWIKRITNRQIIRVSYLWVGIDGCHDVVVIDLHPIMSHGRKSPAESPKCVATRIRQEPEAHVKIGKTRLSGLSNQMVQFCRLRRHSRAPAALDEWVQLWPQLWPSDVWMEDRQEPRLPKRLKRQIIDLIYEKKKKTRKTRVKSKIKVKWLIWSRTSYNRSWPIFI